MRAEHVDPVAIGQGPVRASMPPRTTIFRTLGLVVAIGIGAACGDDIALHTPEAPPAPTTEADPASAASGDSAGTSTPSSRPPAHPPSVEIDDGIDGARLPANTRTIRVSGTARADTAVAAVFARSGPNTPRPAASDDGFRTFTVELPLIDGENTLELHAVDTEGRVTDPPLRARVEVDPQPHGTAAPRLTILAPVDDARQLDPLTLVRGSTESDVPIVRVEISRDGTVLDERPVLTDDHFRTFSRHVPLVPGETHTLAVRIVDAAGREDRVVRTVSARAVASSGPPDLILISPRDGEDIQGPQFTVRGRAQDRDGVREVRVRTGVPHPDAPDDVRWSPWQHAASTDGYRSFTAPLDAHAGDFTLEARAIDITGVAASQRVALRNSWTPELGPATTVPLRVRPHNPPLLLFDLDEDGINAIIPPDIQRQIRLAPLESTPLLVNLLERVRNACGTDWQRDHPNPRHDCSLTPLGQTFVGDDGTWRSSPEYALVRLLTMTPANVSVDGTSIAGLQELADGGFFGITIGGGFSQILADALGIARTDSIVSIDSAAAAFRDRFVASHPEVDEDGALRVSLYDALRELSPVGDRLGPAGGHPGIFDPSFTPRAALKGPDFQMRLGATSNLRWVEGLRLGASKTWMAVVDHPTLGADGPILSFDFFDPDLFDFLDLIDEPRADLRFSVVENPRFVDSCSGDNACMDNLPDQPLDPSSIWATEPWEIEHIIAYAAWLQYRDRTFSRCYIRTIGCQARVTVGDGDDPPGWTRFNVLFNMGNPPRDQYIWELIAEVAQVALHRFGDTVVEEGDLQVAFTIEDVPVGTTADELREAIRPVMQEQADDLAHLLLGDFRTNNDDPDILLRRSLDGELVLVFASTHDPRPDDDDPWPTPGFFAQPDLRPDTLLSSTNDQTSGFPGRHVLRPNGAEDIVWVADREGRPWRLTVDWMPDSPDEIRLHAQRRLR